MNNRITLQKFTENDFSDYFKLVNDDKVMEMITERAIELEEATSDYEELMTNNKLDQQFGSFKILEFGTAEFIGLAKLEIKERNSEEAELGYMILPKYWGKRIATEVAKQLIKVAKTTTLIKRVIAIIDPKNIPSRKVLINNGFESKAFKDFDGLPGEILELKVNT